MNYNEDQLKNNLKNAINILNEFLTKYPGDEKKDHYNDIDGIFIPPQGDSFTYLEDFMSNFRDCDSEDNLKDLFEKTQKNLQGNQREIVELYMNYHLRYYKGRESSQDEVIKKLGFYVGLYK